MNESDYTARRRGNAALIAILIAVVAFVGGGAAMGYAARHWQRVASLVQPAAPPQPTHPVTALTATPPAPARIVSDPAIVERVEELDDRVEAIDSRAREASGNADRAEGLLVAFAARRIIDRGQPLGYLEQMLRTHFGGVDPQAVAMTIAASQRPVTLGNLQDGFATIAPRLVAPPPRQSWWTGFRRELGTLFVVRRADTPSPLPGDRRDRARRALDEGQVELALSEVARLPGAPAAKDWIAAARRYVLAHNALDRIETAALLAPPPAPPVEPTPEPVASPAPAQPAPAPSVQQN